jgi:hypothetical protein
VIQGAIQVGLKVWDACAAKTNFRITRYKFRFSLLKIFNGKRSIMKKALSLLLLMSIFTTTLPLSAREEISELAESTDQLYRTGAGAQDGAYTALSMSMIGWGVGLAIGIAVLAATLNHGSGGSSHAHTCH